jgi:hypothetical protein
MSQQVCPTEWMKLGEAAFALGVSEITLRRKVKGGRISHELRDGKYYVLLQKDPETGKFLEGAPENYVSTMANSSQQFDEQRLIALQREIEMRDGVIRKLKRTVEDQETLIGFLEQSLSSLQTRG